MCLDTLASKRTLKRVQRQGAILAWKIVKYNYAAFTGRIRPVQYNREFEVNKDTSRDVLVTDNNPYKKYRTGFHAYANREDALDNTREATPTMWERGQKVVPVLLRRIVAVGKQDGYKVYVAREMTILWEMPANPSQTATT